ncbi:MAG: galactose mutarotase [Clostridia bacterium]|nr:galactose mutarotase [Clostridia bacterium]
MITQELFGKKPCGSEVYAYTLTNKNGASVKILTMGGIIQSLLVPDRDGKLADVVLGFDNLEGYLKDNGYHGAIIGRYCNRIANGRFTLNGITYQLALNENGKVHLHGGNVGFSKKIWDTVPYEKVGEQGVIMTIVSEDAEENYPGTLRVKVTYSFTDENELTIHYEATCDQDTVINMTNHAYFNLGGYDSGSIFDHELMIDADEITEINDKLIPTGNLYKVEGTPFDFNLPTAIGARVGDNTDTQAALIGGYDHNYVLKADGTVKRVAELYDEKTGRVMSVMTDQPSVQLYTSVALNGEIPMKGGVKQTPGLAVCLETQHAPDSPNHDNFPSTKLRVGEKYDTTTIYAFGVK